MEKYSGNMDSVDPQLRNNFDLVSVMEDYETSWSFGKEWLVAFQKQNQITTLASYIDVLR